MLNRDREMCWQAEMTSLWRGGAWLGGTNPTEATGPDQLAYSRSPALGHP